MEEKENGNSEGQVTVSRRDFVKSAGLVLGGVAAGAAAGAGITASLQETEVITEEGDLFDENPKREREIKR